MKNKDDALDVMFKDVEGWRAFELDDGIGLAKASALRELPYDLDPKRAPYAKKLYWSDSVLTAVITPTRDVITREWIKFNIEPIIIMVAPASMIDPEQISFVQSNYALIGRVSDGVEDNGVIYYLSKDNDGDIHHNYIVVFPDRDVHVSFGFSASDVASEEEIRAATLEPLVKIAANFRNSAVLDLLGAANRAARSAADLAFEVSLSGSFVPEGSDVIYPIKGLDDGWTLYAHNGNEAIYSMLTLNNATDSPSDLIEFSRNRIFEIPRDDTNEVALGWREDGIQLFLAPPSDVEADGITPLLITVNISNDAVVHAPSKNYEVLHSDDEGAGGVEVFAFGSLDSSFSDEIGRFDHSYVGMIYGVNCSVNAICVSSTDESPKFYDDAFVLICRNIAEYVGKIAEVVDDNE